MNERRLLGFLGEGGCEPAVEGNVLSIAEGEVLSVARVAEGAGDSGDKGEKEVEIGVGRVCKGCSWCVAVLGELASESAAAEKYAEVGVEVDGVGGTASVFTVGLTWGETLPACGCGWNCGEACWTGRGRVKLGLGLGIFNKTLLRFPVGLGLRLLSLEIGLVKPLWLPSNVGAGAMIEMASRASSSDVEEARISAALSSTEGTD